MATLKQKTAFKKVLENIENKNPKTAGQILVESGYDKLTAKHPSQVLDSKGFQKLLSKINDDVILSKFYEILCDNDKRASIQAGIELLKLKDRYPANKSKIIGLFDTLSGLEDREEKEDDKEDDNATQPSEEGKEPPTEQ